MTRYRLTIEYDGGAFAGWQRQANGPSIQAALEAAVHAFCGETVTIQGAGRTDSGVHALAQVAHLDLEREADPFRLREALNFHLRPQRIAVLAADAVADDFNARFDAVGRVYLYKIINRPAPLALEAGRAWWVRPHLDVTTMNEAAQTLVGKHDFSSFRASQCQAASPVKTLDRLSAEREGETIFIRAEARSFLHHQVRNIAGTLKLVGEGKWSVADVSAALAARRRPAAGPTAPAHGLYLVRVDYPAEK